jgi:hypothetical protein
MNHVQQSSTQESPSIVILGVREWKMELLAIWQRGVFIRCVFALSDVGIEGAGGGFYRRAVCKGVVTPVSQGQSRVHIICVPGSISTHMLTS